MRLVVLSDVHANLAALLAVLREVSRLAPDQIICLGDLVGYYAQPSECISLLREEAHVIIAGNHDYDTAREAPVLGTSSIARQAQRWTRQALSTEELRYLTELPSHRVEPGCYIAAHGCYLNPHFVSGYVTTTMLEHNLKKIEENPLWPGVGLCGHTHVPMIGWLADGCEEQNLSAPACWPKEARAVLINPGSVGQPRDGDPRASFALIDLEQRRATVHRVAYDTTKTIEALRLAGLPPSLGERLLEGR